MKCLSAEETVNTSSHSRNSNYNINSFLIEVILGVAVLIA